MNCKLDLIKRNSSEIDDEIPSFTTKLCPESLTQISPNTGIVVNSSNSVLSTNLVFKISFKYK